VAADELEEGAAVEEAEYQHAPAVVAVDDHRVGDQVLAGDETEHGSLVRW
jgi:hypothetical protein